MALFFPVTDGDFLVNIFSPDQRRNYNLESLWKRAEVLDVSDCLLGEPEEAASQAPPTSLDDWLGDE